MPKFEIDSNKRSLLRVFLKNSMDAIKKIDFNNLYDLRFCKKAILPYPRSDRDWKGEAEKTNFVEFLNQFFTTAATIIALENECFKNKKCTINLGEMPGRDIVCESEDASIIAEIFAVTKPTSNSKLKKEVISLAKGKTGDPDNIVARYAFFILSQTEFNNLNEELAKRWATYFPRNKPSRKIEYDKDSFLKDKNVEECSWICNCTLEEKPTKVYVHCISESYVEKFIQAL